MPSKSCLDYFTVYHLDLPTSRAGIIMIEANNLFQLSVSKRLLVITVTRLVTGSSENNKNIVMNGNSIGEIKTEMESHRM